MVVATRKFSEFSSGGDLENDNITVGLEGGENKQFNNPWTFLPEGSTAARPPIAASMYFRLRLNTDLQAYEYYNSVLATWVTVANNVTSNGPFVIYEAFPAFTDAFNLGSLASGLLKQTVSGGTSTPAIATNGVDYYGPGMTGSLYAPSGVEDINGNFVVTFAHVVNGTNGTFLSNAGTGQPSSVGAFGADTNVDFQVRSQGTGYVGLYSQSTTVPFKFFSGTSAQHITNFIFSNTSATRNVTWQDANGTVAYLSDIPSAYVESAEGTADQVLVNGTSGTPQTGALTFTTPQDIGPTSIVQFSSLKLLGNLTLEGGQIYDVNGAQCLSFGTEGVGTATNLLNINNAATTTPVILNPIGTDTNIGLSFICKGTGACTVGSESNTPFQILSGTARQHSTLFSFSNTSAIRTVIFPDASGTVTLLGNTPTGTGPIVLQNGPTLSSITFNTTAGIIGTTTNNTPNAGSVGEVQDSNNITPVSLTSNVEADLATLVLGPGDYNVTGVGSFAVMGGSGTRMVAGLSKTSVTIGGINEYAAIEATVLESVGGPTSLVVPQLNVQVAAATTQTIYLVGRATFGVSCEGYGRITATRIF